MLIWQRLCRQGGYSGFEKGPRRPLDDSKSWVVAWIRRFLAGVVVHVLVSFLPRGDGVWGFLGWDVGAELY